MPASPTKLTSVTLRLPWPPAVNHYWRHVVIKGHARVLLSKAGRTYRDDVQALVLDELGPISMGLRGRLAVSLECTMPDRRKRDLDGLPKAVLDALQNASVFIDDEQVDELLVLRLHVEPPGCVDVTIQELTLADFEKGPT